MLKLLGTTRSLRTRLNAVAARMGQLNANPPLLQSDIDLGLSELNKSGVNYGCVDLDDEQQLALLYHWLAHARRARQPNKRLTKRQLRGKRQYLKDQETAAFEQELEDATYTKDLRKLIILGAGSAAAYYVNAMGEGYDHRHTTIIGELDPWKPNPNDKRSRGEGYINHEKHLIGHWGKTVPKFSTRYMQREKFAAATAEILNRIKHRIAAQVEAISLDNNGWIRITCQGGSKLWAKKVIIATGAGPHARRGFDADPTLLGKQVLDLDEFMRSYPPSKSAQGMSVVVHGPNAGIDAVERAGECGFDQIYWFMSQKSEPVFLSGNRLLHAPKIPPTKLIERDDFANIKDQLPFKKFKSVVRMEKKNSGLEVSYITPNQVVQTVQVDLYVYALGQDGGGDGAVLKILGDVLCQQLEPIYDIQGRHSSLSERQQYENAVHQQQQLPAIHENVIVAFRLKNTTASWGIEIIGAAANQVAVYLDGKEGRDVRTRATKMNRVAKEQPGTVLTNDQLGTIKSAIGSQMAVMPRYISNQVNFSTDDRSVLRMHIAIKYPNVKEDDAQRIIQTILDWRRTTTKDMSRGFHPLGYDAWWQRHFVQMLEYWNAPPEKRESVAKRHQVINAEQKLKGPPGFQRF